MSLAIRPLSADLQRIVEKELNEVPTRIAADLQAFREWIAKQPHLNGRTDDQHLVSFLRGTKYSLERAKQKYDLYYSVRSGLPEIFKNRDPQHPKNLELIRKGVILPLRSTETPDGPRIIICRMTDFDTNVFNIYDVMRVLNMLGDILLMTDDNFVVAGQVSVVDMTGSTLSHLGQLTPRLLKAATVISQDGSPIRMKGIHYVHTPSGFMTVFNVFKNFLNEKNRGRILVHGSNFEDVLKYIPKNMLPREYGGDNGTVQELIDHWEKVFMDNRDFLIECENYGTDEKKRVGKSKLPEDLFGTEGSFRKLEVD